MEAEAEKASRPLQRTIQKPVWLDERFLKGWVAWQKWISLHARCCFVFVPDTSWMTWWRGRFRGSSWSLTFPPFPSLPHPRGWQPLPPLHWNWSPTKTSSWQKPVWSCLRPHPPSSKQSPSSVFTKIFEFLLSQVPILSFDNLSLLPVLELGVSTKILLYTSGFAGPSSLMLSSVLRLPDPLLPVLPDPYSAYLWRILSCLPPCHSSSSWYPLQKTKPYCHFKTYLLWWPIPMSSSKLQVTLDSPCPNSLSCQLIKYLLTIFYVHCTMSINYWMT